MLDKDQIDAFRDKDDKPENPKSPSVLDPVSILTFPGLLMARFFKDSKESSILRYNKSKSKD